ncbi:hypothetical protein FACS18949_11760 [Clostridia bacterium]|nr:hypothetical protein FACS18949_11760 [Clostridia bacterium]
MDIDIKYRISCVDFHATHKEPKVIPAKNLEEARFILWALAESGAFQSSPGGIIPGLSRFAAIEYWNESEQDWIFFEEQA